LDEDEFCRYLLSKRSVEAGDAARLAEEAISRDGPLQFHFEAGEGEDSEVRLWLRLRWGVGCKRMSLDLRKLEVLHRYVL
jgi:hypothetical protein